jgi:hypothetical protein
LLRSLTELLTPAFINNKTWRKLEYPGKTTDMLQITELVSGFGLVNSVKRHI